MTGGLINHEVGAPPLSGFPHTMLNVKKVKDNMRLAFIEKLFTNRKIGTNMQTRYLRFKGMCRNPSLGLATKAKGNCKGAGQRKARELSQEDARELRQEEAWESHHILPGV
jgi:hypothetical protein